MGSEMCIRDRYVNVKRQPRVILFSTGNEIVEQSKKLNSSINLAYFSFSTIFLSSYGSFFKS